MRPTHQRRTQLRLRTSLNGGDVVTQLADAPEFARNSSHANDALASWTSGILGNSCGLIGGTSFHASQHTICRHGGDGVEGEPSPEADSIGSGPLQQAWSLAAAEGADSGPTSPGVPISQSNPHHAHPVV